MLSSLFGLSLAVAVIALLAALALGLGALGRLRRLRLGAAVARVVAAALLALLAAAAGLVAFGLAGYRRLLAETEVARVAVRAVGPERWLVQLTDDEGRVRSIPLVGDQWRLEGRVLRFRGVVGLLGAAPVYRLERLSGRFSDPAREPEAAASAVALAGGGLDLAELRARAPRLLGFVESEFGSGTFMPLFDGARYRVLLGIRGGFTALPADEATASELRRRGW